MKETIPDNDAENAIFETIAQALSAQGYAIVPNALPEHLACELRATAVAGQTLRFQPAGVGRGGDYVQQELVRSDKIAWIDETVDGGQGWLAWSSALMQYLNRRLYLGLFSFESHFAHYAPGDFYQRHLDAFRGQTNRVLSLVAYLNPGWQSDAGGEIVIYRDSQDQNGITVKPEQGTCVIFLSEQFPHEVRPATEHRYSIAGWFRVNSSANNRVDPPR